MGSDDWNAIENPGVLVRSSLDVSRDALIVSCDLAQRAAAAASAGPWDRMQWAALEPMCDGNWAGSAQAAAEPSGAKAGPRAMSVAQLRRSCMVWIDQRFRETHARLSHGGWLERAFLTYYAGPADGRHALMVEQLLESTHAFSQQPIVVAHFGVKVPSSWTVRRFPRLILMHLVSAPRPMHRRSLPAPTPLRPPSILRARATSGGRSTLTSFGRCCCAGSRLGCNWTRIRCAGLNLWGQSALADTPPQFVAPGVDALFDATEREVTEDYAMPILPAHFLDRGPSDGGAWWKRYCPEGRCVHQTQRWGHAHPTWTYWAQPWLSRWLRRQFRDETLPPRPGRDGSTLVALRISDIPEDEDLLNVGTWEEGGTKQWCKVDNVDPTDFEARLAPIRPDGTCTRRCGDVTRDQRWHPDGVPKVFYEAHHAVDPEQTAKYIAQLKRAQAAGKLAPPILFHSHFFNNPDALRAAHPSLTCVI